MDQMLYCACGYSKVQFKDGTITMVKYHHDTVKPGDVIGRYTVDSDSEEVDMEIYFGGKTNRARLKIDHIGILASSDSGIWKYKALPGDSLKVSIWRILHKTL